MGTRGSKGSSASVSSSADRLPVQTSQESSVHDFFVLLKPGVLTLVVFTGACGVLVAPGTLHPYLSFLAVLSIALGAGGAGAINMWFDADIDKLMVRTRKRPIPAGRLNPESALEFGLILGVFSVILLYLSTNLLAAVLLAFSIFFYAVVYTMWLKRWTPQNIVIGGAAGAFPPVIGWVAVTGTIDLQALCLFVIIFLWTPPHFWALALYRSQEYAKAGVPMLPVVAGLQSTKRHIVFYSFLLFLSSYLPCIMGMSGAVYGLFATLGGLYFCFLSLIVFYSPRPKFSYQLFGYSILYLFLLFAALLMDKLLMDKVSGL